MKLGLVFFSILVLPVLAEKSPSTLPSTNTSFAEPLETRTLDISDYIRNQLSRGKAKFVQEAENELVDLLSRLTSPHAPEECIQILNHQLFVILKPRNMLIVESMIYPSMEVTVYTILLSTQDEEKILKLLPPVSPHWDPIKPIEWRLTDEQFSPILQANLDLTKTDRNVDANDTSMIGYMREFFPSCPRDIPSGQFYSAITGIDFEGFLKVRPSSDNKGYELSYSFMYSMSKFLYGHDRKATYLKDNARVFNAVSLAKRIVYVQRISLNKTLVQELLKWRGVLKDKDQAAKDTFKDPKRNMVLYIAFQIKPADDTSNCPPILINPWKNSLFDMP
jgi:hypothetical protein